MSRSLQVFSRSAHVTSFSRLTQVTVFSRVCHRSHIFQSSAPATYFPRLADVTRFPALGLVENGIGARRNYFGLGVQESHFKTALIHSCSWFFGCFFLVAVCN